VPGLFVAPESQKHPFLYRLRPTRVSIKGVGFSPRSKRAAPFCEKKRGYILFEVVTPVLSHFTCILMNSGSTLFSLFLGFRVNGVPLTPFVTP
jgi:hypothetical protein